MLFLNIQTNEMEAAQLMLGKNTMLVLFSMFFLTQKLMGDGVKEHSVVLRLFHCKHHFLPGLF